jgi:hypothetical protein
MNNIDDDNYLDFFFNKVWLNINLYITNVSKQYFKLAIASRGAPLFNEI